MKILALDTSGDACSTAIYDSDLALVLGEERLAMERGHAEALFAQIERVTIAVCVPLKSIDRFAVTTGPGSFTGVRIGLAAARGFALAAKKPLIGIGTLEVIAAALSPERSAIIISAIDARRGELYCQAFEKGAPLMPAFAATPSAAASAILQSASRKGPIHLIGSGAALLDEALRQHGLSIVPSEEDPFPKASVLARLAADRPIPAEPPAPLYLRAPDAKLPQRAPA